MSSERQALVADSTAAMRDLMRDTLLPVGYRVAEAGSAQELAGKVHEHDLMLAQTALVVVTAKWSQQCSVPISVAASKRKQLQLPALRLVVIHEWGTLGTDAQPTLNHCEILGLLEKPFDMGELEHIARMALAEGP